jgi:hypothetical protein
MLILVEEGAGPSLVIAETRLVALSAICCVLQMPDKAQAPFRHDKLGCA